MTGSRPEPGRGVLVTGASSGLGAATVLRLERLGFRVFAGVRRTADADRLVAQASAGRIVPVTLDVAEPDQIRLAAEDIARRLGPTDLWALVNNAGISLPGPIECLSAAQLRRQFEVGVVGPLTLVRALLPMLRRSRGRIVQVTSGLGRVALPYLGAYAASQFAKEGASDSLRRELRPFGVAVTVVRPGAIATPIWDKMAADGTAVLAGAAPRAAALYRGPFHRFLALNERRARRSRTRPEDFAATVARVLTARRPRTRYTVGRDARLAALGARLMPDTMLDRYLAPLVRDDESPQ
jgi:NAD(P)-dependent dehydrogenase (short-subunit alcohol dehydrogenase family)